MRSPEKRSHSPAQELNLSSPEWLPTPVFLPREFQGQRNLAGCSSHSCKESDTTEWACMHEDTKTTTFLDKWFWDPNQGFRDITLFEVQEYYYSFPHFITYLDYQIWCNNIILLLVAFNNELTWQKTQRILKFWDLNMDYIHKPFVRKKPKISQTTKVIWKIFAFLLDWCEIPIQKSTQIWRVQLPLGNLAETHQ